MGSSNSQCIRKSSGKILDLSPPDPKQAKVGEYLYAPNELEREQRRRWEILLAKNSSIPSIVCSMMDKEIHKGFPQKYRWEAWKYLLNVKNSSKYYEKLSENCDYTHDIYKDLNRTFPEHPYFDKEFLGYYGQNALKRILRKFAGKYPNVGYCQGMNFIVGFLLMISGGQEQEVFMFFEAFYHKFNLSSFFSKEMQGLKHNLWIFDKIFQDKMCKLYWHLKNEEISEDMWVFKFFLTLFTKNFPISTAVYMWDLILLDGFENIYRIVLAVMKLKKEKLLKMSTYELMHFFNNPESFQVIPQVLLKKATTINLSRQKKEGFEREYKSLPDQFRSSLIFEREPKSERGSPKITVQMVTEDPPVLSPKCKSLHNSDYYKPIINPFLVESAINKSFSEDSGLESFNAEDVLNNLVTDNDLDSLYIR